MNFEEVVQDNRRIYAMDEEIRSIDRNNTRELGSLPKGHMAIGSSGCTSKEECQRRN
jgi:hypothetical protein